MYLYVAQAEQEAEFTQLREVTSSGETTRSPSGIDESRVGDSDARIMVEGGVQGSGEPSEMELKTYPANLPLLILLLNLPHC